MSIFLFDVDQRLTAAAGGLHRRLGHEFALMQGKTAQSVARPEVWPLVQPGYADALSGHPRTIDVPAPGGRGTYEAAFQPLLRDGAVVGGMVTVRDVSRERATDRSLAEATAAFSAMFDASGTAFGLMAPNGRRARVNHALVELVGTNAGELLAASPVDPVHVDDRHELESTLRTMRDGTTDRVVLPLRVRGRHGSWLDLVARMTAVRTTAGLHGIVVELTRGGVPGGAA